MRRHSNPYRINDPDNLLEVGENSSHPELGDARRIWKFHAYTFHSATEVENFFASEGLNLNHYEMRPKLHREFAKNLVVIDIVKRNAIGVREGNRRLMEG